MWLIATSFAIAGGMICYWYGNKEGYQEGYEDAILDYEDYEETIEEFDDEYEV